jgi:hypothetical protein
MIKQGIHAIDAYMEMKRAIRKASHTSKMRARAVRMLK